MKYTDHPDIHRLRGSISGASGLEAAQKLDPPEQVAPHVPDEVSARGPGYSQPNPSYHQPKPKHQSSILNMLDENVELEQYPPPNRATTEPMSQYDDRSEDPSQSELGRYSPDSDDELHRASRRRSCKFTLRSQGHVFVACGMLNVFSKGVQHVGG
jgi:hypothetical protein